MPPTFPLFHLTLTLLLTSTTCIHLTHRPTHPFLHLQPISNITDPSLYFCGCLNAPALQPQALQFNLSVFTLPKAPLEVPKANWTEYKAMLKQCEAGYYRTNLADECLPADPLLMINLNSNRFLTGQQPPSQLQKRQVKFLNQNPKFKHIICPESTPFLTSDLKCIDCPQPKKYFNLQTLTCMKCPQLTEYDPVTMKCKAMKIPLSNLNARGVTFKQGETREQYRKFQQEYMRENKESYVCGLDRPFAIGGKCVNCSPERPLFIVGLNRCFRCVFGAYFDFDKSECLPADPKMSIPLSTDNILLKDPEEFSITQNEFLKKHPDFRPFRCMKKQKPFFDGEKCIGCEQPKSLFNVTTLSCDQCPQGGHYSHSRKSCEILNPLTVANLNASNLILPFGILANKLQKLKHKQQDFLKQHPDIKVPHCPESKPYFNGHQCISCKQPQILFNLTNFECTSCPEGSFYSKEIMQCKKNQTQEEQQEPASGKQKTKKTDKGLEGAEYYTDLDNPNVVIHSNRTFQEVARKIQKSVNKDSKKCPKQNPFFNGQECISCEKPTQYFDLEEMTCVGCQEGQYIKQERKCAVISNVQPIVGVKVQGKFKNNQTLSNQTKENQQNKSNGKENSQQNNKTDQQENQTSTQKQQGQNVTANDRQNNKTDKNQNKSSTQKEQGSDIRVSTQQNNKTEPQENETNTQKQQYSKSSSTGSGSLTNQNKTSGHYSNLEAKNWISSHAQDFQKVYLLKTKDQAGGQCPQATPFFDGNSCVSCGDDYFDMDNKKCVKTEQGKVFNPNLHSFVQRIPEKITDLTAMRIYFEGKTIKEIREMRQEYREKADRSQSCSKDRPFYDGITCIECQEPYPIFNIAHRTCIRCKDNEVWQDENNACKRSNITSQPNLADWSLISALKAVFSHKSNQLVRTYHLRKSK